jgi:hypothetical protein
MSALLVQEYVDGQFIMIWEVSDFIADNLATFSVYDGFGCKEGGANDITKDINNFYAGKANSAYLQTFGLQPDPSTPHIPSSVGDGRRLIRIFMGVQPTVANTPVFQYVFVW